MRGAAIAAAWVLVAGMSAGCAAPDGEAASGPPACASIESFADQLVDVGITYDYEPSQSPAELTERVGVVLRGELTGQVKDQPPSSEAADAYVGYEITVHEILAGESPDGSRTVVVSVPYNPYHADARDYARAVTPGVPVVAFAYAEPHAPGGLIAAVEGFVTGCESDTPIGWVGHLGQWSSLTSLDDVAAAATSGTG